MTNKSVPKPPIKLSKKAKKHWPRIVRLLGEYSQYEELDGFGLARYCETFAEWEELNDFRSKNDPFQKLISNKGQEYFQKHPKISRLETLETLLLRMEKQLGISRSARKAEDPEPGKRGRKTTNDARSKLYRSQ